MLDFNYIEDRKVFADRLRAARIKKDLTQKALADLLNVKRETVTQWESSKNLPEYSMLSKICNVLEIDYCHLFGEYFESRFIFHEISKVCGIPEDAMKKLYMHDRKYIAFLSWLLSSSPAFDNFINSLLELKNSCERIPTLTPEIMQNKNAMSSYNAAILDRAITNRDKNYLSANKCAAELLTEIDKLFTETAAGD